MRGEETLRERPPTLYDVAALAGVSAQTVSRLMKGFEGIRPETRTRVENAVAQLGYRPNLTARQLRTRKSMCIGALVHEMFEYGTASLLRGAAQRAREAGYSLNIVGVNSDDERLIDRAFDAFEEDQVAGILAITLTDSVRTVVERRTADVPIVMDPADGYPGGTSINHRGAVLAAQHLIALGHVRVGMLLGPESSPPARQRRDGFLSALVGSGATCVRTWQGDWSIESGSRVGAEFDPGERITAIFAANDSSALGLIHGFRCRGIDVPGDVSVVGFDAIPIGAFTLPGLSSVRADFEGQGRSAIDVLLSRLGRGTPSDASAAVSLVVRESTATSH